MSQEYYPGDGSSSAAGPSRFAGEEEIADKSPFFSSPPSFMTVGNGSTSDSATALMTSLNQDSGYGGSIAEESAMDDDSNAAWHAGLMEDRPTPVHTPTRPGEWNPAGRSLECTGLSREHPGLTHKYKAEHEKQVVASHVSQLL